MPEIAHSIGIVHYEIIYTIYKRVLLFQLAFYVVQKYPH